MENPRVVAIILKNGRDEMAARAVRSFNAQTYPNKKLLIWDTGAPTVEFEHESELVHHVQVETDPNSTIGQLRNEALGSWTEYDIACHFDSDDLSHPNRIAEQVALLQSSGAECVGYKNMLFWRDYWNQRLERDELAKCTCGLDSFAGISFARMDVVCKKHDVGVRLHQPQAWLYTGGPHFPALGTSLCYWRKTWERVPFPERMNEREQNPKGIGEDRNVVCGKWSVFRFLLMIQDSIYEPRMIASIHSVKHQQLVRS